MLEPDEGKLSSPVLRGVGSRKAPLLPGSRHDVAFSYVFEILTKPPSSTCSIPYSALGEHAGYALCNWSSLKKYNQLILLLYKADIMC